jgi:hypothetical protein
MKTLNLSTLDVREMDVAEMQTTSGGCFLIGLIVGAVVAIGILIATDNGGQDVDCSVA